MLKSTAARWSSSASRPSNAAILEVDIAIVGDGAAGAAAALTLADRRYRVLVVAPPVEPGDRPGDSLAAAGVDVLAEIGVATAFAAGPHRISNVTYSAWGSALLAQSNAIANPGGASSC